MADSVIVYDPNLPVAFVGGEIVPTGRKPVSASEIIEMFQTELSKEYTGDKKEKKGLTKGQAMILALADKAADGDVEAIGKILDRIIGKPIQQVQNFNVTSTWKEFLDELKADRARRAGVDPSPF